MSDWTPLHLFVYSVFLSGTIAFAALLRSDKPLTIRTVIGEVVYHGIMGGGLVMLCYDFLGWKNWRVIGTSILYGGGVITAKWIKAIVQQNFAGIRLPDPDEPRKP